MMSEADIAEAFIQAAEIERRMPRTGERPAGYGGYTLPWVHELADINGRRRDWKRGKSNRDREGDKLLAGDDPLREWRWAWIDEAQIENERADVGLWESCMEWTRAHLDNEGQRRALWAWAFSKAGGRSFKWWCAHVEHISRTVGLKRKNAGVTRIYAQLARSDVQNIENGDLRGLQDTPENGDIVDILGSEDGKRNDPNFWSDDAAFKSFLPTYTKHKGGEISVEDRQFSIRAARNAERRARYARLRAA